MADVRAIILVAIVTAGLTYGGFLAVEAISDGGLQAPDSDQVTIQGTTYHLDRTGRPTVVGEVYNGKDYPVDNVNITVTFYNDGTQVATATGSILTDGIAPGDTAPFDIHYQTQADVTDYSVTVTADRGDSTADSLTGSATIINEAQHRVTLSGTVENNGDAAQHARVIVTFYDENNSVIGVRTARPAGTVDPGDTVPFEIHYETIGDVPSLAQEFDHYDVAVERVQSNATDQLTPLLTRTTSQPTIPEEIPATTG